MGTPPRVALLIESSRAYGRDLLRGIAGYGRTHGPWAIYCHERTMGDAAPAWLRGWRGEGIIARLESRSLIQQIEKMDIATVDLCCLHHVPGVPMVRPDEPAVVRLAVDHLLGCGLRHFAYCGFAGLGYSESRCRYFVRYVAESGREPHVYQAPHPTRGSTSTIEDHGLIDENDVAAWLRSLPKPLGLVACNDIRAQQVLNACTEYGIAVPRDVAVIGVDNDEVLCELAYPPLSSVELNVPRIGYEAAALLDGMMRGLPPAAEETAVAPLGIVARESTNVLAVPDDLAAALRFIRERACDGIDVPEVLRHVLLSRSTLERRFAAFIGSTPKAEILRVKIQRVKELLSTTDLPLARIAPLAGFNNVEPMCNLFKSKTGRSPGQYRKESRA